jgi:hypothetical protein
MHDFSELIISAPLGVAMKVFLVAVHADSKCLSPSLCGIIDAFSIRRDTGAERDLRGDLRHFFVAARLVASTHLFPAGNLPGAGAGAQRRGIAFDCGACAS